MERRNKEFEPAKKTTGGQKKAHLSQAVSEGREGLIKEKKYLKEREETKQSRSNSRS